MAERLIDAEELFKKLSDLETLATNRFVDTPYGSPCRGRYRAQMDARRETLKMIEEATTITPESLMRHGRWIKKHKQTGGFRRYTGIDDMGEQHTITVDERVEFDDLYCSECGKQSADNFLNYCPNCGAKMDLEE